MFCSKCGAKVNDDAKFCNVCGNPLVQVPKNVSLSLEDTIETKTVSSDKQPVEEAEKVQEKVEAVKEEVKQTANNSVPLNNVENVNAYNAYRAPKKPVNKKLVAEIVGGVIALCIVVALAINSLRTINLNKYYGLEVTGYNGYGQISYNSEVYDKIYTDYGDKLEFDQEAYLKRLRSEFKALMTKTNVPALFLGYDSNGYTTDEVIDYMARDYAQEYFSYYDDTVDMIYATAYTQTTLKDETKDSRHLSNGDQIVIEWYDINDELKEIKGLKNEGDENFDGSHIKYVNLKLIEKLIEYGEWTGTITSDQAINYVYEFVKNTDPSKYFNYKFKYSTKTYTVKDLTEAPSVDIFKELDITYSGIAPNGSAKITFKGEEVSGVDGISFSVSNDHSMYEGLDVGDVITASLSYDDPSIYISKYGGIPSISSKEFTVDALDSLLSKSSQLSEDALNEMKGKADGSFRYIFDDANQTGNSLEGFEYKGLYILSKKNSYYSTVRADNKYYYDIDDKVILVYEVKVRNYGGSYDQVNTIYWCASFDNLLVKADGTVEYDLDAYHTPNNQINITGDNQNWFYNAYNSLDDLYNNQVAYNTSDYNVEENMQ